MEKVNLQQVFDTLNEQRRNLNRCLGCKNNTYQQILSKIDKLSFWQRLKSISFLQSAQKLLKPEEYEKLWSLPKLRSLAKIIDYVLYKLKYDPVFALDSDCFYIKHKTFESLAWYENIASFDFVLLPYGQDNQVYEFVISGVFLKNMRHPKAKDNAFIYSSELEFVAGFYKNKCFIVRIVPDIKQDKQIMHEIKHRSEYGLVLSKLQPQHIRFIQRQMLKLRQNLTLWMECKNGTLLPGELGDIGVTEMLERYPMIGKHQWQQIFNFLLVKKQVFSKSLWQKLVDYGIYDGVFDGIKMMLQKFSGNPDIEKNEDYFYFVDDTKVAAVRIFWRQGWMAEMFVQSKENIEFPVLTNNFVYVVKTVKDLSKEPLLQELYSYDEPHYIWYTY